MNGILRLPVHALNLCLQVAFTLGPCETPIPPAIWYLVVFTPQSSMNLTDLLPHTTPSATVRPRLRSRALLEIHLRNVNGRIPRVPIGTRKYHPKRHVYYYGWGIDVEEIRHTKIYHPPKPAFLHSFFVRDTSDGPLETSGARK